MSVTQSALLRRRGDFPKIAVHVISVLAGAIVIATLPWQAAAAQQVGTDATRLLTPIEDIVSASSWLLLSGQDPRYDGPNSGAMPDDASGEAEAPEAVEGTPAAGFDRVEIVTRQIGQTPVSAQPSIAIDPLDPDHLVLGVSALDLPSVATYVSFDGGESWDGPNQAPYFQQDAGSVGGPLVAFDRAGNVLLVSQSISPATLPVGDRQVPNVRTRIVVSTSLDGGLTWGDAVSAVQSTAEAIPFVDENGQQRSDIVVDFLDKPSVAIGPDPQRLEREIVSIAYTEFRLRYGGIDAVQGADLPSPVTETTIRVIRSSDGGQTWSDPLAVSSTAIRAAGGSAPGPATVDPDVEGRLQPGQPPAPPEDTARIDGSDQVVQGAQTAILSDGTVVVAYFDSTRDGPHQGLARVMAALSTDGGRTYSEPAQAGLFREIHLQPRTALFRWWGAGFPRLAVGPNDELYIAVTARPGDRPNDDGDILLLRSLDKGSSWESPAPVNAATTDASQFFPAIAVTPDGTLVATWGDMRDDPRRVAYTIYVSESRDQGLTLQGTDQAGVGAPDHRVTDVMSNSLLAYPAGQFLGDQFAITAADDAVYLAWTDIRLAADGRPDEQVAFASRDSPGSP